MNIPQYPAMLFLCCAFLVRCTKDNNEEKWIQCNYTGSYENVTYTESLVGEFSRGVYGEDQIPGEIMQLEYGRIEIDFHYNGGGLTYFAPLFYYGSINKKDGDDYTEEPQFHLAVEIGHYNVIPSPVEYLFYTICTYNYPRYCRDTYFPVVQGIDYTMIIDKKPEGIIIQLMKGNNIVNIFPHAFFADSMQMFFNDVTDYIDVHKGDSLQKVLMVGKGFAGIERGIHDFNGEVSGLRIYKYALSDKHPGFTLLNVRNQHTAGQQVTYEIRDERFGEDKYIIPTYEYWPYKFESGELKPNGNMQTVVQKKVLNKSFLNCMIDADDIGFYKISFQTVDRNGVTLGSTIQPFEIWIYPEEWEFEFY